MNAPSPLTPAHAGPAIPQAVSANADLLRYIVAHPGQDHIAIAKALGRRSDNVMTSIRSLSAEGLARDGLTGPALTDAGRRALDALAVYAGAAAADPNRRALRHDQLSWNPDNDRTDSGLTDESIERMMGLLAREDFLEAPRVRRDPNAEGKHVLMSGGRRWLAWGRLIAEGVWSADKAVVCIIDDSGDLDAEIRAMIINVGRENLDKLEAAEGWLRIANRYNLDAGEIARRIGTINKRQVLYGLQVAREATPEAKAAYRASEAAHAADRTVPRSYTWTQLRNSVQAKKDKPPLADLDAKAAAALGEIVAQSWCNSDPYRDWALLKRDIVDSALTALTTAGVARFEWRLGEKGIALIRTPDLQAWLDHHGFVDGSVRPGAPRDACEKLQAAVVGDLLAAKLRTDDLYVTPAFNLPEPGPARPEPRERPAPTGAAPAAPADDEPAPPLALLLVEMGLLALATEGLTQRIEIRPSRAFPSDWADWFAYDPATGGVVLRQPAKDWLTARNLHTDADTLLREVRAAYGKPQAERCPWVHGALQGIGPGRKPSPSAPAPTPAAADPGAAQGESAAVTPGLDPGATPSTAAMPPALTPMQQLQIMEIVAVNDSMEGQGARVRWTEKAVDEIEALEAAGMIRVTGAPFSDKSPWTLHPTDKGEALLMVLGVIGTPTYAALDKARRAAHWPRAEGEAWSTEWLNSAFNPKGGDEPAATVTAGHAQARAEPWPLPFKLVTKDHDAALEGWTLGMTDEAQARAFAEMLIAAMIAAEVEIFDRDGVSRFHFTNTGAA